MFRKHFISDRVFYLSMGSSSRLLQTMATLAAVLVAILVPGATGGIDNNGRLVQRYSLPPLPSVRGNG